MRSLGSLYPLSRRVWCWRPGSLGLCRPCRGQSEPGQQALVQLVRSWLDELFLEQVGPEYLDALAPTRGKSCCLVEHQHREWRPTGHPLPRPSRGLPFHGRSGWLVHCCRSFRCCGPIRVRILYLSQSGSNQYHPSWNCPRRIHFEHFAHPLRRFHFQNLTQLTLQPSSPTCLKLCPAPRHLHQWPGEP